MRDVLIGIVIIFAVFLVGDFIYSNNHVCNVGYGETKKCGILKNQLDIDIELFDRYW